MGNFFRKVPTEKYDESLITFLKTRRLQHINEAIECINDSYPTSSTLTLDEYFDVFAPLLEDRSEQVFLQLENNKSLDGKVDVYESLSAIIVFCGEEFPVKLQFIFQMFDFDRSGQIELKELVMTLQSSIRSLCKLVYIPPPSLQELEHFAGKLFLTVDVDRSRSISFKEFSDWMCESWELQDFLLQYALIQTYQNAERRTKEKSILLSKIFEQTAGGGSVNYVDSESLKIILQKGLDYLNENLCNSLLSILEDSTKEWARLHNRTDYSPGTIAKEPYLEVMQAWAAFDATDINNDNQVSIVELKYLLFAYEGDIPDDFRVQEEMQILDKDGSGFINRQEWVQYLCLDAENQGKSIFRGNLKRMFNKFDTDNSGALSLAEIKALLKDNLKEHAIKYKHRSLEEQEDFETMIASLADQIIAELNNDQDQNVTWIEFKHFMEKSYSKQETLRKFLGQV